MLSLQQLSMCRIPFNKMTKCVHFMYRYKITKKFCTICNKWYCDCLFVIVHELLQRHYEKWMWLLIHMPSYIYVYLSVDFSSIKYTLCNYYLDYYETIFEHFAWNGFSDDILVDNCSCFNVRINNTFDLKTICDIYSRLLFNVRKELCYQVNCRFYKIYGSIVNHLYGVKLLRTSSFDFGLR